MFLVVYISFQHWIFYHSTSANLIHHSHQPMTRLNRQKATEFLFLKFSHNILFPHKIFSSPKTSYSISSNNAHPIENKSQHTHKHQPNSRNYKHDQPRLTASPPLALLTPPTATPLPTFSQTHAPQARHRSLIPSPLPTKLPA